MSNTPHQFRFRGRLGMVLFVPVLILTITTRPSAGAPLATAAT